MKKEPVRAMKKGVLYIEILHKQLLALDDIKIRPNSKDWYPGAPQMSQCQLGELPPDWSAVCLPE